MIFQLLLHTAVFWLWIEAHDNPAVELFKIVYFFQYAVAAAVVSYVLLPQLYRNRYFLFGICVVTLLAGIIVCEELLLEPLFFPNSRASSFPGVWYTLTEILPLTTILAGGKFAYDAFHHRRRIAQLQVLVRESELDYLRAQINPHFLFNNLNNLYSHAVEQSAKTPEIILGLAGALRYMLYESRERLVPLRREVEQLHHLVRLGELQIEERGRVSVEVGGNFKGYYVAPLLLNPFVENAFKHATASQVSAIEIMVDLRVSATGRLAFECTNTYAAGSNRAELDSGIGLANVRKRLDLIYPGTHRLKIDRSGTYYRVALSIQLTKPAVP